MFIRLTPVRASASQPALCPLTDWNADFPPLTALAVVALPAPRLPAEDSSVSGRALPEFSDPEVQILHPERDRE